MHVGLDGQSVEGCELIEIEKLKLKLKRKSEKRSTCIRETCASSEVEELELEKEQGLMTLSLRTLILNERGISTRTA